MDADADVKSNFRKLGLGLSGGGFRASLFHLGVLRRLAELGLLQQVNVLSTVSGGSIVAALYFLHLKRVVETTPGPLTRDDFVAIVDRVEQQFREGVTHNPRGRLFLNLIQNLGIICTGRTLGHRMGVLYNRYLYRSISREILEAGAGSAPFDPERGVPLTQTQFKPETLEKNRLPAGPHTLPGFKLILNSTALNTGKPFRFTLDDVGDPQLGYIRYDELDKVDGYRRLLNSVAEPPKGFFARHFRGGNATSAGDRGTTGIPDARGPACWLLAVQTALRAAEATPGHEGAGAQAFMRSSYRQTATGGRASPALRFMLDDWAASRQLVATPFRLLRRVKAACWCIEHGDEPGALGRTPDEHQMEFWESLGAIDKVLRQRLEPVFGETQPEETQASFRELLFHLYYLRSAQAFAVTSGDVVRGLTLTDAVVASANFPPVFAPYPIYGLYARELAEPLALSDGGVHDNQGIDALLEEGCTHVIISDAGSAVPLENAPATGRVGMMLRFIDVLMDRIRSLQLRRLRERRDASEDVALLEEGSRLDPFLLKGIRSRQNLDAVVFFDMKSKPSDATLVEGQPEPLPAHPHADAVAELRTDLDLFGRIEQDSLIYQGYQLADRFVRKYLLGPHDEWSLPPEFVGRANATSFDPRTSVPASPIQYPEHRDVGWEARVLRNGAARFLRAFNLVNSRITAVVWVALAIAAGAGLCMLHLSPEALAKSAAAGVTHLARYPLYYEGWPLPLDQLWVTWAAIGWLFFFFVVAGVLLKRNRMLGFTIRNVLIWPLRLLPAWLAVFFSAFSAVMLASGWLWKRASGTYTPPTWLRLLTGWWRY
jgi:predicted acylesterase/phospholipase RssA